MANHAYIIERENTVIQCRQALVEIIDTARVETEQGRNATNYDCWGTLRANVAVLATLAREAEARITEAMCK